MKAPLALAALPFLAFALPHPQEAAATTASATNNAAPVLPSDGPLISAVSSLVSSAGLTPYATPLASIPITEWTALGDSYASGYGSNGLNDYDRHSFDCNRFQEAYAVKMNADARLPGDPHTRKLNFGACSGASFASLRAKQLTDSPSQGYVAFGKPQIAVVTIGGNDLGFGDAINSCIVRARGWPNIPDCGTVLSGIESKIESQDFQGKLDLIFLETIIKGRSNGGASPPESFQLFVNGYVPFWNEVDTGCDTINWQYYPFNSGKQLLTIALRKRMNDIVRNLNFQLARSAFRLEREGVIYVEGFQDAYTGHLFCDPAADSNLKSPITANTWFWAPNSPWRGGEGTASSDYSLSHTIVDVLVTNQVEAAAILAGTADPSTGSDAFTSEANFAAALSAADIAANNNETQDLSVQNFRIFHPKGTALAAHAKTNIDVIVASRNGAAIASAPTCTKGTTIKQADLKIAMNTLTGEGNGSTSNNCCGGGTAACGPILAQHGTVSISLCGSTMQCMGCGDLVTAVDSISNTCLVNGAMGGAKETITGKPGLSVSVNFVDSG